MKMKSVLLSLFAVLMFFGLQACGQGPEKVNTPSSATTKNDGKIELGKIQQAYSYCVRPTSFWVKNSWEFVYVFNSRPPSYDAFIGWVKVQANPYDRRSVLIQKRDICAFCGCNLWCVKSNLKLCAK